MLSAAKHLVSPGGRRGPRGCFAALSMTRERVFLIACCGMLNSILSLSPIQRIRYGEQRKREKSHDTEAGTLYVSYVDVPVRYVRPEHACNRFCCRWLPFSRRAARRLGPGSHRR